MKAKGLSAAGLDIAGMCLFAATPAWFLLSSIHNVDASFAAIGVVVIAGGSFFMARASALWLSPLAPAALVVGAAAVALLISDGTSAPLGYKNANASLFGLAAFAALFVWSAARGRGVAIGALAAACVFGVVTVQQGSFAASALLVLAPGVVVAARFGKGRAAVLACAGAVLAALATTTVLGLTYSGDASVATSTLTERRVALWHDALAIAGRYPATGAGFHRFEQLSPTAHSDPDARWAHNEYLQVAAETGIPGLILVTSLVLWGFIRLAREPVLTSSAVAAAGLAAVAIHASIDYVLHFVAISVSAAALVGAALGRVHDLGGNSSRHDSNLDTDQRSG